jgi:hypothetical protein
MTREEARALSGKMVRLRVDLLTDVDIRTERPSYYSDQPAKIIGYNDSWYLNEGFVMVGWESDIGWPIGTLGLDYDAKCLFDGPQGCVSGWYVLPEHFDLVEA